MLCWVDFGLHEKSRTDRIVGCRDGHDDAHRREEELLLERFVIHSNVVRVAVMFGLQPIVTNGRIYPLPSFVQKQTRN